MTQPIPLVSDDDDDDEPTQSYTHSQLETMRSGFREPEVRPEDFDNFGNSGTPAGVLGSRNEACLQIVGTIGGAFVEQVGTPRTAANQAPPLSPTHSGKWGELPGLDSVAPPVIAGELNAGAPAAAELERSDSQELITLEPPQADVSEGERAPANKRLWLLIAGPLAMFGLLVIAFSLAGSSDAPEQVVARVEPLPEVVDVPEPEAAPPPDLPVSVEVAVPEPPDPEPEPEPVTKKAKKRWESSQCKRMRERAKGALSSGDWNAVVDATKKRCWEREEERGLYQAKAFFELKKYDACLNVRGRSAAIKQVKNLCAIRKSQQ